MRTWPLLGFFVWAGSAHALPVDKSLELELGDVRFLRINSVEGAEVDPPDLCTVEQMPSLELVLTPHRLGTGLLYVYEQGRLEVYRLRVGSAKAPAPPETSPSPEQWKAARAACPEVEERRVEGESFLHLRIPDAACRAALLPLLASDLYPADHLRLVFDVAALQAQVADMHARLVAAGLGSVQLGYQAATLAFKTPLDPATRHRTLRAIWPAVVGRLNFDEPSEEPDGGGW